MIPAEVIERVRAETDIVGLIGEYVTLKRSGRSFVGLCPFHQEKTPSFNVSPDRQAYYCFGCGAGGNALTFLMSYENIPFPDAVKRLAERLGIRIEYTAEDDPTKPLVDALELAGKIYAEILWSEQGLAAQRYLAGRGLKKETVKSFGLGLVPQDVSVILSRARAAKLSTSVLTEAGVLATSQGRLYPFLSGRIVFPIHTPAGKLVGFSGRVWGEDPNPAKYVNTHETKLFKKGRLLYGLSAARAYLRREGAIIVEGQMDVLKLAQAGFHNVVAPLGTAFTEDHALILSRYAEEVVLVFDGDEAGRNAAQRALGEVLAANLEVRLLLLPEGEDPDSYLSSHSPEEFRNLLSKAMEPMPFLYDLVAPKSASERRKAAEVMISTIRRVPDSLRRELYLDEASTLIGVERSVLAGILKAKTSSVQDTRRVLGKSSPSSEDPETRLLKMIVQDTEFIRLAAQHISPALISDPENRDLLKRLFEEAQKRENFSPGEILDLLPASMQSKVSAWSFSDVRYSREEFLKALAHYLYRYKRQLLRHDLKEAERSGDTERARDILSQLNELVKKSNKIYQEI